MKNIFGVNFRNRGKLTAGSLLLACFLFFTAKGNAQSIAEVFGTPVTFNTKAEISTTRTSNNYLTLQYSINSTSQSGWTVRIQANSDFSNGTATIAASFVSLTYASAVGGPTGTSSRGYQSLSTTTAKSMINSTRNITSSHNFFQQRFNMRVAGGNHLNVGSGTYSTTLTVTLYDKMET
jgi:hypothetical protein